MDDLVKRALTANSESAEVEFKREFSSTSPAHWCEVVKDIVAIANSGGGVILVGVQNDGEPASSECNRALDLDPAKLTDQITKYTDVRFAFASVQAADRRGSPVLAVRIQPLRHPVVFSRPGTYEESKGKQERAFSAGQVYFRHGAKSEIGTSEDLRAFVDREVARIREEWLGNVRKVVEAPRGAIVTVTTNTEATLAGATIVAARLVHAEDALPVAWRSPDETHPYRQKELITKLNSRLDQGRRVNSYDVQLVRKRFNVDADPNFAFKSKFGSTQYSDALVGWIVEQAIRDPSFFATLRQQSRTPP